MQLMDLEAIIRSRGYVNLANKRRRKFPYLLRGFVGQSRESSVVHGYHLRSDMQGFMYLVAVIDWHNRYLLSWRLST